MLTRYRQRRKRRALQVRPPRQAVRVETLREVAAVQPAGELPVFAQAGGEEKAKRLQRPAQELEQAPHRSAPAREAQTRVEVAIPGRPTGRHATTARWPAPTTTGERGAPPAQPLSLARTRRCSIVTPSSLTRICTGRLLRAGATHTVMALSSGCCVMRWYCWVASAPSGVWLVFPSLCFFWLTLSLR